MTDLVTDSQGDAPDEFAALRALAESLLSNRRIPSPWKAYTEDEFEQEVMADNGVHLCETVNGEVADYIAECSPERILALLSALSSTRAELSRQNEILAMNSQMYTLDITDLREKVERYRKMEAIATVERGIDGGFDEGGLLAVGQALLNRAEHINAMEVELSSTREALAVAAAERDYLHGLNNDMRDILVDVHRILSEGSYGVPCDSEAASHLGTVIERALRAIPAAATINGSEPAHSTKDELDGGAPADSPIGESEGIREGGQ